MKKVLIAICFLTLVSSCATLNPSAGQKKMKRYNMYMNDHPDRDRKVIRSGRF